MPIYKIALGSVSTFLLFLNTPNSFSFFFLSVFHSIFFLPFFHIFPFFPSFFLPFFFLSYLPIFTTIVFPLLFIPFSFLSFFPSFFLSFFFASFLLGMSDQQFKMSGHFWTWKDITGTPKTYLLENSPFEWLKRAFPKWTHPLIISTHTSKKARPCSSQGHHRLSGFVQAANHWGRRGNRRIHWKT